MSSDIISATANVVAGYAARNDTTPEILADLIPRVAAALESVGTLSAVDEDDGEPEVVLVRLPGRAPAVPIEESVHDDHLVCLEDGQALTCLRRYLQSHYGLSPEQYRKRWGLPPDYPFTAPAYSRRRREIWANMQGRK